MAAKKSDASRSSESAPLPNLTVSRAEAEAQVAVQIDKGRLLAEQRIASDEALQEERRKYQTWNDFNKLLLRRMFDSPEMSGEYSHVGPTVVPMYPTFNDKVRGHLDDVRRKLTRLESIKERLELCDEPFATSQGGAGSEGAPASRTGSMVHGRDEAIVEGRQFPFIANKKLRDIIERDYSEIQRAYTSHNWKSVIILCGGTIEAVLLDLLMSNKDKAASAKCAPKETDITRWAFSQLIGVAVELGLVSSGVEKLSSPIREYRNLVHPGNELRSKLRFDAEEAKIAVEVLNIVHRDLSN